MNAPIISNLLASRVHADIMSFGVSPAIRSYFPTICHLKYLNGVVLMRGTCFESSSPAGCPCLSGGSVG